MDLVPNNNYFILENNYIDLIKYPNLKEKKPIFYDLILIE